MKRILAVLFGIFLASSTIAMEKPQLPAVITLESTHHTYTIPKEQVMLSETLKHMIEDTGTENIPVPQPLIETFDIIAPYFEWAFKIKNNPKLIEALSGILAKHTEQDLVRIVNAFNYLDIDTIRDAAIKVLAFKLVQPERVQACLKKGSYELAIPNEIRELITQEMVKLKNNVKSYWIKAQTKKGYYGELNGPQIFTGTLSGSQARPCCFSPNNQIFASEKFLFDVAEIKQNPYRLRPFGYENNGDRSFNDTFINAMCFSPNSSLLATTSEDHRIRIWNIADRKQIGTSIQPISAHAPTCIYFNHDGTILASGSTEGRVYLWDAATHNQIGDPITCNSEIYQICFNHDGTKLAASSRNLTVRIWDVKTRQEILNRSNPLLRSPQPESRECFSICFNKNDHLIAARPLNNAVALFYCESEPLEPLRIAHLVTHLTGSQTKIKAICFNHDGTLIAAGTIDGSIYIWDLQRKIENKLACEPINTPLKSIRHSDVDLDEITNIYFNYDNTSLAVRTPGPALQIFDLPNLLEHLKPEQFTLLCYAFDCIRNSKPLDLIRYPGIAQINLPNDFKQLEELKSESFFAKHSEQIAAAQELQPQTFLERTQTTWDNFSTTTRFSIAATAAAATAWSAYKIWKRINKK